MYEHKTAHYISQQVGNCMRLLECIKLQLLHLKQMQFPQQQSVTTEILTVQIGPKNRNREVEVEILNELPCNM